MQSNRSLLEELVGYVPDENKVSLLQNRGNNAVSSAINLLEFIAESFSEEEAADLSKRFISAIRNRDPKRFERGIAAIHESRRSQGRVKTK